MTTDGRPRAEAAARHNELAAAVTGGVFVVVGLLGFTLSGDHSLTGHLGGQPVGVFRINTLHNLVHVGLGALLIAAPIVGARMAQAANLVLGSGLVLLAMLGPFATRDEGWNVISLNGPDSLIHLAFGAGLLAVAAPGRRTRSGSVIGARL